MSLNNVLLVLAGGGAGSLLRYLISVGLKNQSTGFPISTFLVNISGCFLIGILFTVLGTNHSNLRLLLMVGLLGGFTTFSSFGLETIALFNSGHFTTALYYVLLSNICGLAAVYLGIKITLLLN